VYNDGNYVVQIRVLEQMFGAPREDADQPTKDALQRVRFGNAARLYRTAWAKQFPDSKAKRVYTGEFKPTSADEDVASWGTGAQLCSYGTADPPPPLPIFQQDLQGCCSPFKMKVPAWHESGESESSWLSLLDGEQQPKWKTIDCNLHACDFTVNTAGMPAIIAAMDQCGVDKAVLLSMAAVKKWSVENKGHRPLRYDDDSGTCYPYSYVDQVSRLRVQ
jgi:hypothetical protein